MGEKESAKIEYQVAFGKTFNKYYSQSYPKSTLDLIDDFIDHYEEHGLRGWKGKISPSNRVPENYENRSVLIAKADKHNLWHVHIGDPKWNPTPHGQYLTSDWVLQFKRVNNYKIVLLELGWHNPLLLPSNDICEEETA